MRELKQLISEIVREANDGTHISERITSFSNYDSKYLFLKSKVEVKVELTNGKVMTIDVTDYFKEDFK